MGGTAVAGSNTTHPISFMNDFGRNPMGRHGSPQEVPHGTRRSRSYVHHEAYHGVFHGFRVKVLPVWVIRNQGVFHGRCHGSPWRAPHQLSCDTLDGTSHGTHHGNHPTRKYPWVRPVYVHHSVCHAVQWWSPTAYTFGPAVQWACKYIVPGVNHGTTHYNISYPRDTPWHTPRSFMRYNHGAPWITPLALLHRGTFRGIYTVHTRCTTLFITHGIKHGIPHRTNHGWYQTMGFSMGCNHAALWTA